jgi:hypothetical protein
MTNKEQATAEANYRDLSAALRTMRPRAASVEMTLVLDWLGRTGNSNDRYKYRDSSLRSE